MQSVCRTDCRIASIGVNMSVPQTQQCPSERGTGLWPAGHFELPNIQRTEKCNILQTPGMDKDDLGHMWVAEYQVCCGQAIFVVRA